MKLSRKLIFLLFLLFLLFGGASLIFDFIYKYPVEYIFDKIVWNIPVSAVFVGLALLLIRKQAIWIKDSYIMTFNQWLAYGFVMGLFIFARLGNNWPFLRIETGNEIVAWHWQNFIYPVKLIDILWLSLLYPLSAIGKRILRNKTTWIYSCYVKIYDSISEKHQECVAYFKKDVSQNDKGFFEEDVPLKDSKEKSKGRDDEKSKLKNSEEDNSLHNEESQQYQKLTNVLVPKLVDQKFQKAFSIGIIGPYGNGKSSFVNHLREEFKDKLKPQRFEIIEFLPAYSHKPEQISTDFFTILASRLKKYHGSLNQSMLTYAAKLIELGVNGKKDIQGLLKPADWFTEKKSASEAYIDLKKIIEKIDIKTIVIIDDVDRLGEGEILEVLRLIRNTANFPNFIFIVAYDKDYVIKTIGPDKDLMYLDKYFQYEMFVPPHRREDLLKSFAKKVLQNKMGLDAEQLEKLREVVNVETLNKTLLDRFVLNYRDVKVLKNTYCASIRLLKEEVDYGDLLHFTLMNRYFPKQVRYIYNNSDELFDPLNSTKKKLEFKKRDFLKKPITVDSFIADIEIKDDSQKKLFKRLFLLLFGIKDDTIEEKCPEPLTEYEKKIGYTESAVKSLRTSDLELSIRNVERTYIYFENFLRDDAISNINWGDKIGTDDFKVYIAEFLSPLSGLKRKGIEKKIENKLKENDKEINSKIKIENAIWACHAVKGAYLESNLIDVLGTNLIVNYPNALANIFGGDNDAFAAFFKKNLWDNTVVSLAYKIVAITELSKDVKAIVSNDPPRYEGKPVYFGSSKEQIKVILISKIKELIKENGIEIQMLQILSAVLDSSLDVVDSDIGFSNYLYSNADRLFDYLEDVKVYYGEKIRFDSAIFKVFTDINKFEKECFDKFPKQEKLIREFHHLLKLHSWRKDKGDGFIPFYFDDRKDLKNSLSEPVMQTIYIDLKEGELTEPITRVKNSEDIKIIKIKDSKCLLEGKHSYLTLIREVMPSFSHKEVSDSLKANKDKFEILSIQTDEDIDKSIIPYCKYNKMIEELKVEEIETEPVI